MPYICNDDTEYYYKLDNDLNHVKFQCNYDELSTIDVSVWKETHLTVDSAFILIHYIQCNNIDIFKTLEYSSLFNVLGNDITELQFYVFNKTVIYIDGQPIHLKYEDGFASTCKTKTTSESGYVIHYNKYNHVFNKEIDFIKPRQSIIKDNKLTQYFKKHCGHLKYEKGQCMTVNDKKVKQYYIWDNSYKFSVKFNEKYMASPYILVSKIGFINKFKNGIIELNYMLDSKVIKFNNLVISCISNDIMHLGNGYYVSMPLFDSLEILDQVKLHFWSMKYGKLLCNNTRRLPHININDIDSIDNQYINIGREQELFDRKIAITNKNLNKLCKNYVIMRKLYSAICKSNPYYCVKYILNKDNVKARYVGGNTIALKHCTTVTNFEIVKDFNYNKHECSLFVPLNISFDNTHFIGYLNPKTNEIFKESPVGYCHSVVYVNINDTVLYISNNNVSVSTQKIHMYGDGKLFNVKKISATIINNINIDVYFKQSTFRNVYDTIYNHFDEIVNPSESHTFDYSSIWDILNFHGILGKIFLFVVIFGILVLLVWFSKFLKNCIISIKMAKYNINHKNDIELQPLQKYQ